MDFVIFGQSQANFFPLFPVFMLSQANQLLDVALHVQYETKVIIIIDTSCIIAPSALPAAPWSHLVMLFFSF